MRTCSWSAHPEFPARHAPTLTASQLALTAQLCVKQLHRRHRIGAGAMPPSIPTTQRGVQVDYIGKVLAFVLLAAATLFVLLIIALGMHELLKLF